MRGLRSSLSTQPALWLALAITLVLTEAGQLTALMGPHVNDMTRLLDGGRALLSGGPPGAVLAAYPPSSVVQFAPLALLPADVAAVLTRIACALILAWMVVTFGRSTTGRFAPWSLVLLLSPPAVELVRIDQFNTALSLLAVILAWRLLRAGRPVLAGLVGGLAMTRPFNAVPAGAGLAGTVGGSRAWRLLLGCAACFGTTVVVAMAWDHSFVSDVLRTGAQRPMVGLAGTIRSYFGVTGVFVMLCATTMLCWVISADRRHRPLDAFLVCLALSGLIVHVGGPYVAVFALPGLARLTAVLSPWWSVGFTVAYAALLAAVTLTSGWAVNADLTLVFTLAPLVVAVVPLALMYTSRQRFGFGVLPVSHEVVPGLASAA